MPERSIIGTRIRLRRKEIGITQAAFAANIGISASYLNLIEWNKRRISGNLLRKIAEALDLKIADVDGSAERRLLDNLTEIVHLPMLAPLDINPRDTGEFIGRYPGWARGLATLARAERQATLHAEAMSERLYNDPFLGESVHHMRTRIAAIRSAAEILTAYPDAPEARKVRFHQIVNAESRALSEAAEALGAYFDKAEDHSRILTPVDEVESLFDARQNHFAEIEAATAPLHAQLTDPHPISRAEKAEQIVRHVLSDVIDRIIQAHEPIATKAAERRAFGALSDYACGAVLMPMTTFQDRAAELQYDIEALADAFSTAFQTVCLRLTALPRGDGIPKFGYFQANAAGALLVDMAPEELAVPRYATACPLWALYRAQQTPLSVMRQRTLFPSGGRFIFLARARNTGATGFGQPRHFVTDMVTLPESDAAATVYAPDPSIPLEEVGPGCRTCPRRTCSHRVADPLAG